MSRAADRWCDFIEPATMLIECGGATHRITWRRGKLVLEDHPSLAAERAVMALGGEPVSCLRMLAAWKLQAAYLDRLAAFPLPRAEPEHPAVGDRVWLPAPPEKFPGDFRHAHLLPPDIRSHLQRDFEETEVRQIVAWLPQAINTRLALARLIRAERRWTSDPADDQVDTRAFLADTVRIAAAESMRSWRGADRHRQRWVACRPSDRGDKPSFEGRIDSREAWARVTVPVSWLVRVWARGVAVVDGCFVLDVRGGHHDADADADAEVVRWERLTPSASEPVTVSARLERLARDRWRVRWA